MPMNYMTNQESKMSGNRLLNRGKCGNSRDREITIDPSLSCCHYYQIKY